MIKTKFGKGTSGSGKHTEHMGDGSELMGDGNTAARTVGPTARPGWIAKNTRPEISGRGNDGGKNGGKMERYEAGGPVRDGKRAGRGSYD